MLIQDLEVVLGVAKFRSITAAAENLDMRVATASAALKRVESALGMELFVRTTRQLRLSSAGESYIPQCEKALLILKEAEQGAKSELGVVEGEMRIALSSDFGRNQVINWLDSFMEKNPLIRLKVHLSDSNIDFYRDAVDIALRYGSPNDSSMYGFKLCDVPKVLCAAPSYLDSFPSPLHPHDLVSHRGLFYQLNDVTHSVWTFSKDNEDYKIKMKGQRSANDGDIVRRWCVAGHGLAVKSVLDVADDLNSGRLRNVLPDYTPKGTELWLICPSKQTITPAIRLLRDNLKEKCHQVLQQLPAHYSNH